MGKKTSSKLGRPPKAPEDRRSNVLMIRVSDAEHELLEQAAAESGQPISRFVREAALRAAKRVR